MPWKIERKHYHVAVVTMNTNKVNAQNPAFFADLHAAFDRLDPDEACRRANPTHDFLKNRRLGSAS